MKRKIKHFFTETRFKKEFQKEARLLIVLTLSFTIAFTWRQTTFDLSQNFIAFLTHTTSSSISSIMTSTFITLMSIILIYSTSHFLKEKQHY